MARKGKPLKAARSFAALILMLGPMLAAAPLQAANEPPDPPATPGQIATGAPSVTLNGRPAARQGDATSNNSIVRDGADNVFINGRPAAAVGSQTGCGGTIVTGSSSVFINGKPMATANSQVTPCTR